MKENTQPFGGLQLIFVGDFGHLAPVPQIQRVADVDGEAVFRHKAVSYAFCSAAWAQANIQLYRLTIATGIGLVVSLANFCKASGVVQL